MLTELRLTNFKAFGETQRIPIKPLTLIFGANNAGKSSILHGLLLGRHLAKKGGLDAHQIDAGDGALDLGGFSQFLHGGASTKSMQWGVGLEISDLKEKLARDLSPFNTVTVTATFCPMNGNKSGADGLVMETDGQQLLELSWACSGHELKRGGPQTPAAERQLFKPSKPMDTFYVVDVNLEHDSVQIVLKRNFKRITGGDLSARDLDVLEDKWEEVYDFPASVEGLVPNGLDVNLPDLESAKQRSRATRDRKKMVEETCRNIMAHFLEGLFTGIHTGLADQLDRVFYLGPLRSYPPRRLLFPHTRSQFSDGSFGWEDVARNQTVRKQVNEWLVKFKSSVELISRDWRAGPGERMTEVLIKDPRTKTLLSHRDVGVGISQVLPIMVAALSTKHHIHLIEQPELHLHPALQAELGDLFIESALGKRGNTFLLETHSEHLILRILRRIRETTDGTLPKGQIPVRPEDVSVIYVQPTPGGSRVVTLPATPDGDFSVPWPGGFFAERFQELP